MATAPRSKTVLLRHAIPHAQEGRNSSCLSLSRNLVPSQDCSRYGRLVCAASTMRPARRIVVSPLCKGVHGTETLRETYTTNNVRVHKPLELWHGGPQISRYVCAPHIKEEGKRNNSRWKKKMCIHQTQQGCYTSYYLLRPILKRECFMPQTNQQKYARQARFHQAAELQTTWREARRSSVSHVPRKKCNTSTVVCSLDIRRKWCTHQAKLHINV